MGYPQADRNQRIQQLQLLVDGLPLRGDASTSFALLAAYASIDTRQRELLEALRERIGPEIGVIDSHFDDSPSLLGLLGFRLRHVAGEDLDQTDLRVVTISCPHRHARLDEIDTFRFLKRGGVIISSDRAIRLPGIARCVGHLKGRPPARARLTQPGAGLPTSAPVWLDAGHLPVDPDTLGKCNATTLASDALTGAPLVVMVSGREGGILHSVPHWLQAPHPELLTAVERRKLRYVPRFRAIGNSYPGVALGEFLAQRAMIAVLIEGLARLLHIEQPAEEARAERGK